MIAPAPALQLGMPAMGERSKDFRYVFANAFSVRLSDNEITIKFGMDEGGDPKNLDILDEVAVVMTPKTLKIMLNNLGNALTAMEAQFGEVSVPPEKLSASFDDMLKTGIAGIGAGAAKALKKPEK